MKQVHFLLCGFLGGQALGDMIADIMFNNALSAVWNGLGVVAAYALYRAMLTVPDGTPEGE